jgi:hypothetical protein
VKLSAALLPLGIAGTSEAALQPDLLANVVRIALAQASAPAIASLQATTLAQGVIRAMFLTKMKSVALGLAAMVCLSAGAGLVTYHARAQDTGQPAAGQAASDAQRPARPDSVAEMRREIERLRLELEQARLLLKVANQEILELRAAREDVARQEKAARDAAKRALANLATNAERQLYQRHVAEALKAFQEARKKDNIPALGKVALSPDGRLLAAALADFFNILDVATGKEIRRFVGHTATVTSLAFAPDGKILASGSKDKTVIFWDIATGKQLARTAEVGPVDTLVFSPNGRILTVRGRNRIWEIDVPSGKLIQVTELPQAGNQ